MSDETRVKGPISFPGYLVLGALTMITPLSSNMFVPALPSIAAAFGAPASSAQLSVSATLVGIAIGQLFIGSISDRVGRRLPALIGTAGFVIVSVLCAVAPTLPVLIGLRLLQGFMGASGVVLARASIRDRTEGRQSAQALSRLLMAAAIAPILGPFFGALALLVVDWHGVFLALAVMGGIAFVMSLRWFPETLRRGGKSGVPAAVSAQARRRLFTDARFWGYVVVTGLLGLISFSWLSMSSFFLREQYGLGATGYSLILGATSAAFLVSAWVNSKVVMTIGPKDALLRGLLIVGFGCTVLLLGTLTHAPLYVIIIGAVIGIGSYGGMIANAQSLGLIPHGDAAGTASALLGGSQFLFGAVVPPLVTHAFGTTWAMSASMLAATVLAFVITVLATAGTKLRHAAAA